VEGFGDERLGEAKRAKPAARHLRVGPNPNLGVDNSIRMYLTALRQGVCRVTVVGTQSQDFKDKNLEGLYSVVYTPI